MAGIYEMAMNGLGIAQEGQERKKQRTLAELVGKAYSAKGPERQQYMSQAYSLDPTTASQAETSFAQHDDRQRASLARAAKMVISAPEEMRASLWPRIVQGLEADGVTGLKPQWSPEALPMAEKIAAMYGEPEQDNTPAAIRELQFLQQNPQLAELDMKRRTAGFARPQIVSVPTGDGGSQQMIFDGTQFTKPNYGGGQAAPNAGGFYEGVQSVISPLGGILGSTTGGQHNVGSKHYSGNAVDIPMGASASAEAKANAQNMIADLKARGFNVRDERVRPQGQEVWGGPHLHVERGLGGGQHIAQNGPMGYTPPKSLSQEGDRAANWQIVQGNDGSFYRVNKLTGEKQDVGVQGNNAARITRMEAERVEKTQAIQGAIAQTDSALDSLQTLIDSPGLNRAVGAGSMFPTMPGSDAATFEAQLDTFKAQTFVPMVAQLKGMGALSDAEGKKLSDAVGALSLKMGAADFRKSLNDIKTTLANAKKRSADKIGQINAAYRSQYNGSPAEQSGSDIDALLDKYK